jgi:hypothetical protein
MYRSFSELANPPAEWAIKRLEGHHAGAFNRSEADPGWPLKAERLPSAASDWPPAQHHRLFPPAGRAGCPAGRVSL